MPQFVIGGVYDVRFCPIPSGCPILHLFQYDGSVSDDGVGVGFDPQVRGSDSQKLRRGNRSWGLCRQKETMRGLRLFCQKDQISTMCLYSKAVPESFVTQAQFLLSVTKSFTRV